ncbi:MAG TPA: hypothetical protein VFO39_08665 [Candidatus Sulfotelmatobacter sp.]|nr:hypothetical protein [Candidatus Sulfotelmatobacter sp.]
MSGLAYDLVFMHRGVIVNPMIIETDMFEHREVKPHFINPCCFGEDFAAWLKKELSRFPELRIELSGPIQEDYGWGLWASRGNDRYWIALSYVGDGPQETAARWAVSVNYDAGLNLVKRLIHKPDRQALEQIGDRVQQILSSNSAIKIISA